MTQYPSTSRFTLLGTTKIQNRNDRLDFFWSKAARFSFLRSFSTKGSQAQLGQQNSLVSLDSYAFPTHEKSVTLSAATTRSKVAAMRLEASAGDGDEDALSPV